MHKRLRTLRFSVRSLLVITALCAAMFGFISFKAMQGRQDRNLIKGLEASRAGIVQEAGSGLGRVVELGLGGVSGVDAQLKESQEALPQLSESRTLKLWNTDTSDSGLASLTKVKCLRELHLTGAQITDQGILSIAELKEIEVLRLVAAPIHD